eukprot:g7075.t1
MDTNHLANPGVVVSEPGDANTDADTHKIALGDADADADTHKIALAGTFEMIYDDGEGGGVHDGGVPGELGNRWTEYNCGLIFTLGLVAALLYISAMVMSPSQYLTVSPECNQCVTLVSAALTAVQRSNASAAGSSAPLRDRIAGMCDTERALDGLDGCVGDCAVIEQGAAWPHSSTPFLQTLSNRSSSCAATRAHGGVALAGLFSNAPGVAPCRGTFCAGESCLAAGFVTLLSYLQAPGRHASPASVPAGPCNSFVAGRADELAGLFESPVAGTGEYQGAWQLCGRRCFPASYIIEGVGPSHPAWAPTAAVCPREPAITAGDAAWGTSYTTSTLVNPGAVMQCARIVHRQCESVCPSPVSSSLKVGLMATCFVAACVSAFLYCFSLRAAAASARSQRLPRAHGWLRDDKDAGAAALASGGESGGAAGRWRLAAAPSARFRQRMADWGLQIDDRLSGFVHKEFWALRWALCVMALTPLFYFVTQPAGHNGGGELLVLSPASRGVIVFDAYLNGTVRGPDLPRSNMYYSRSFVGNASGLLFMCLLCTVLRPAARYDRDMRAAQRRMCARMPLCSTFCAEADAAEKARVRSFRRGGRCGTQCFHVLAIVVCIVSTVLDVVLGNTVYDIVADSVDGSDNAIDRFVYALVIIGNAVNLYGMACLMRTLLSAFHRANVLASACTRSFVAHVASGDTDTLRSWWVYRRYLFEYRVEIQYRLAGPAFFFLLVFAMVLSSFAVYSIAVFANAGASVDAAARALWAPVLIALVLATFLGLSFVEALKIEAVQDQHADMLEAAAVERRFMHRDGAGSAGGTAGESGSEWIEMAERLVPYVREQKYFAHVFCLRLSWQLGTLLATYITGAVGVVIYSALF